MRDRALYFVANVLGGVVIVLLLLDPTRPLRPVFALLAAAVLFLLLPSFLRGDDPWADVIIRPRVPGWLAIPSSALSAVAIFLLLLSYDDFLPIAATLAVIAGVLLWGGAAYFRWRRR